MIIQIITGTPLWVWAVLVFLLYAGYKATKNRIVFLPKLFIIPLIFMSMNYPVFITGLHLKEYLIVFAICLTFGFTKGYETPIKINKKLYAIELPGNYYTMVIMLIFFSIKYTFGCLEALQPAIADNYALSVISLSAALSGFFFGRSICYVLRFYKCV